MKLIRAEFENFRLLRDLHLDFSTDTTQKLTVIRAENESGKTTILNGLQWAFFGDDALPRKGLDYRLHPIDWDVSDQSPIPITVQVDFEITRFQGSSRYLTGTREQYRIIRSAYETLDAATPRPQSTVKLFQVTDVGSEPIPYPEAWISEELPSKLREVFFTDGDRALSFIEATASAQATTAKRQRVEKAVQSLLGLDVINEARRHVKKTASEVNRTMKNNGFGDQLACIADKLEQIEKTSEKLEDRIEDSKSQLVRFDQEFSDTEKKIEAALIKGNREKLKDERDETKQQLAKIDELRTNAAKEHSNLLKSLSLPRDLLAPVFKKAAAKLSTVHDPEKIPITTIPVLEQRLKSTACICGESLDPHYVDGERRRVQIQRLINESRQTDSLQTVINRLFYRSIPLTREQIADEDRWIEEYDRVAVQRDKLESVREEHGKKYKALEKQLDDIPDVNIQELRTHQEDCKKQRDRFNAAWTRYETQLEDLKKTRASLIAQRQNLLREQKRGVRIRARLDLTTDVERVLETAYARLTNEELTKVSNRMNTIFLKMIGADPEQGAIIRRAEISDKFDILVYGPNDRSLNPDIDLNGASRRALTLSFILALTKVSEVEAPNVIDTPLGMMSDYVKKSVLKTAIHESSQLVLFLTRSEIADCEEILDSKAGRVITLTNPAHFPRMLVNDPQVEERKVLRCDCNHRKKCVLCERRLDEEIPLEPNPSGGES